MKFILTLTLLFSLSALADSSSNGASEKTQSPEFDLNQDQSYAGVSAVPDMSRDLASDEKKQDHLSMKDDAYYTGSSY